MKTGRQKPGGRAAARLKKLKRSNDARTKLEVKMALEAPLPYELEAFGQLIVDGIKKLPPEAQPPALALALESINVLSEGVNAFIRALPGWPPSLSPKAIKTKASLLEAFYKHAPATSPLTIFKPGVAFVEQVEGMVDPLGDDPPTIPHQLGVPLVDHETILLIEYIIKNLK